MQVPGLAVARPVPVSQERRGEFVRLWSSELRRALWMVVVWRFVMAVVGVLAFFVMPRGRFSRVSLIHHAPHWPVNPITLAIDAGVRSDAVWYARIALHGYTFSTRHMSSIVFYPLYPLLIRAVSAITGSVWLSGMIVSTACLFGLVVALHAWLQARSLAHLTPRVTALLLLYPWALFFAAMYSESLYLLLVLCTFLSMERRWWYRATLCAGLLALSRPTGGIIVPSLLLLAWEQRDGGIRAWVPACGPIVALAGFAIYQYVRFGTPFAAEQAQAVAPWFHTIHQGLMDVTLHPRPGVPRFVLALLLIIGVGVLAAVPLVKRRLGLPYALFTALSVLVPASTGLLSLERYVMVAFPIFVVFAATRMRKRTISVLTVELWLLVLLAAAFEAGWSVW